MSEASTLENERLARVETLLVEHYKVTEGTSKTVIQIYQLLKGNDFGDKGLVRRVIDLEITAASNRIEAAKIVGAGLVIMFIINLVIAHYLK